MDEKVVTQLLYFYMVSSHSRNMKGRWLMDSVDSLTSQITGLVDTGKPAKALKIVARHYRNPDVNKSLVFCLNAAHAAVRTKQSHAVRRRLLVRYLKLVARCPEYHRGIEGNFWYVQAAVAVEQKNPVAALMMYQWVLELEPGTRQVELIEGFIRKITDQYPNAVVRDKLTRKDLVGTGPRHRA